MAHCLRFSSLEISCRLSPLNNVPRRLSTQIACEKCFTHEVFLEFLLRFLDYDRMPVETTRPPPNIAKSRLTSSAFSACVLLCAVLLCGELWTLLRWHWIVWLHWSPLALVTAAPGRCKIWNYTSRRDNFVGLRQGVWIRDTMHFCGINGWRAYSVHEIGWHSFNYPTTENKLKQDCQPALLVRFESLSFPLVTDPGILEEFD